MQLTQRLKTHIFKFDFTILIALVLLLATSCDSSDNNEDTVNLHKVGSINSIFYFLHKAAEPFNCLEQDNLA